MFGGARACLRPAIVLVALGALGFGVALFYLPPSDHRDSITREFANARRPGLSPVFLSSPLSTRD
jgi:hypothetical protein